MTTKAVCVLRGEGPVMGTISFEQQARPGAAGRGRGCGAESPATVAGGTGWAWAGPWAREQAREGGREEAAARGLRGGAEAWWRSPGVPSGAASASCAPGLAIAQQVRPQGAVAPLGGLGLLCDLKCLISLEVCRPRPPAPSSRGRCGHSPAAEGALVDLCGKKGHENKNMRQCA